MANNLFKNVINLIKKTTNTETPKALPTMGLNENILGTPIVNNTGIQNRIDELNADINNIKTNMKGIIPKIISGMEVKALENNKVTINSGSVYTKEGLYEFSDSNIFVIDNSTTGIKYLVVENGTIKQANDVNDSQLLLAKISINVANAKIDDDANSGYTNNYIISGRDIVVNSQYQINDDTKLLFSNLLREILADNLVGTIKLNEGLSITNQQNSVRLNSTGMRIYNDDTKYADFNRDGVYFYNDSGLMLSQYTKNGATVGNISIQPNSIQSTNFLAGNRGFQIKSDGNVEFNNITARGTIVARDGKIGGWTIGATELYAGEGVSRVGLRPGSYPIYAGSNTPSQAPFRVDESGNLYAQDGIFKGALRSTVMSKNAVNVNSGNLIITSSSKIIEDITTSATSINILDSGVFIADDLVKIGTEIIRVISASSTNLTVSRAFDSTASTHSDGDVIYKIGEYNTNDKGYIELKGDDNQIIIHDIDADTSNYTDTETVILGKQSSGKYGLRMIEGEIGLSKHEYSSVTDGIYMGEVSGTYKVNIGNESNYIKWTGDEVDIKGIVNADNIQENFYIVSNADYGANLNQFFIDTDIQYPAVIQFESGDYYLTNNIEISGITSITFLGLDDTILNSNGYGFYFNNVGNVYIEGLYFKSAHYEVISFLNFNSNATIPYNFNVKIEKCTFYFSTIRNNLSSIYINNCNWVRGYVIYLDLKGVVSEYSKIVFANCNMTSITTFITIKNTTAYGGAHTNLKLSVYACDINFYPGYGDKEFIADASNFTTPHTVSQIDLNIFNNYIIGNSYGYLYFLSAWGVYGVRNYYSGLISNNFLTHVYRFLDSILTENLQISNNNIEAFAGAGLYFAKDCYLTASYIVSNFLGDLIATYENIDVCFLYNCTIGNSIIKGNSITSHFGHSFPVVESIYTDFGVVQILDNINCKL